MKKFMSILIIALCLSCSEDDPVNDVIVLKANPNLTWKKLTYSTYANKAKYLDSIPNFDTKGSISSIIENLGVIEYENQIFNSISTTTFKTLTEPFSKNATKFNYTRDSLNYSISIRIDTITFSHEISSLKPNYKLLEEKNNEFVYLRTFKKTSLNHLANDETIVAPIFENQTQNIINENRTKKITTAAGEFNTDEYSIIAKNKTTGERTSKGKSTQYYSQDILIQSFESLYSRPNYIHKKELTAIEYLQ